MPIGEERVVPDWDRWGRGEAVKDFAMWEKMMQEGQ